MKTFLKKNIKTQVNVAFTMNYSMTTAMYCNGMIIISKKKSLNISISWHIWSIAPLSNSWGVMIKDKKLPANNVEWRTLVVGDSTGSIEILLSNERNNMIVLRHCYRSIQINWRVIVWTPWTVTSIFLPFQ